jgi:hypothetical protein
MTYEELLDLALALGLWLESVPTQFETGAPQEGRPS